MENHNGHCAIIDCCSLHRSTCRAAHRSWRYFPPYLLAILRHIEKITESAPQLCLQVYIMLRQWSFPSYTVVPSVFSLYVDIFRYYVIIALAVHWLTLGSTIILIETFDSGDFRRSFFLSFLAAFPSLLHSSRCPKPVMIVGYVVLILQPL